MASVRDLLVSLRIVADVNNAVKNVGRVTRALTEAEKTTAAWREAAQNLAVVGGMAAGAAAAIALPLKASVGAYAEEQAALAHVATAMNDGAQTMANLAEVQRVSTALSEQGVISVENLDDAYYISRSNMLEHAQALEAVRASQQLVTATTRDAAAAQAAMEPTTRTLSQLYFNFGGSLAGYADQLAKLQTKYSFRDISEVTNALQYAMPVAKQAGVSIREMNASLALLSAGGLHGQEAGVAFQQFVSKLTTDSKLAGFVSRTKQGGVDLQRTLQTFAETFGAMSPLMRAREMGALGFGESDIRGVSILMDKYTQMGAIETDLANSSGTAAQKAALMTATMSEQFAMMANQWNDFKIQIGAALAPTVMTIAHAFGSLLSKVTSFATAHPALMKFLVVAAAGTAAVLALGGAIALAGAALAGIAATVGLSALFVLPIAAAIGAVASAAVLLYQKWGAIVSYVKNINWRSVGMDILKGIGQGLLAGLVFLTGPLGVVAKYIVGHFKGHSPPPLGPLHAGLGQIRIVETIAEAIRPAPMLTAIRRVAAATAFALPIAIGAGAAPAVAAGPAAGGAPIVVNLTVNYTINGAASDDLKNVLEKHGYDLVKIINSELARQRRTNF